MCSSRVVFYVESSCVWASSWTHESSVQPISSCDSSYLKLRRSTHGVVQESVMHQSVHCLQDSFAMQYCELNMWQEMNLFHVQFRSRQVCVSTHSLDTAHNSELKTKKRDLRIIPARHCAPKGAGLGTQNNTFQTRDESNCCSHESLLR